MKYSHLYVVHLVNLLTVTTRCVWLLVNIYGMDKFLFLLTSENHQWRIRVFVLPGTWTHVLYTVSLSLYIPVTALHRNRFPFNNQPDALTIQIYSVIKLYMFRASSLPIIRSFRLTFGTGKFHAGFFMTVSEQSQDGTAPSWLCLETVIKNLHETYQCRMYSRELLMTGREDARNMLSFITE